MDKIYVYKFIIIIFIIMETKIGTTADLHYLDFSKNTKNSKNIEDKTILSTIEQTGNNVIKFI
jgi:hypothetical protein